MVSHCLLDGLRRSIRLDRHNEDLHKQTEVVYSRSLNHSYFAIPLSDSLQVDAMNMLPLLYSSVVLPSRISSKRVDKRLAV
jgi:hypothetical protein